MHKATCIKDVNGIPGTVYMSTESPWTVYCGSGALALEIIQKPGGKPLAINEFLKGYKVDFN